MGRAGELFAADAEVAALLARLMDRWPGTEYDLTRRNCCHFAEELCSALGVEPKFPGWVNRLASAGAAVGDACAAVLVQAQQLDDKFRIREQSGGAWLKACDAAAGLDSRFGITQRASEAVGAVAAAQQKIAQSEAVQSASAKAKQAASALDEKLGGIGGKASKAMASVQNRMQSGLAGAESMAEAAKAPEARQ